MVQELGLAQPAHLSTNGLNIARVEALLAAGEAKRARLMAMALAGQHSGSGELQLLLSFACLGVPGASEDAVRHARGALALAGQPGGPSEAKAQLALGAALDASTAPGAGLPNKEAQRAQQEALRALEAAVALAPDDPAALYSLGLMQAEAGQLQPALQHARPALPWALAALVLSAQRRGALAADAAVAGLEAPGRHAALLQRVLGRILLHQGDVEAGLAAVAAALAMLQGRGAAASPAEGGPGTQAASQGNKGAEAGAAARAWCELGGAYLGAGRPDDACFCLCGARAADAWSPPVHALGAQLAAAAGDLPAARAGLEAALAMDAAYTPAAVALGRLLRQPGAAQDLTLAAAHLAGALRVRPDSAMAWSELGHVRLAQQRVEDAESSAVGGAWLLSGHRAWVACLVAVPVAVWWMLFLVLYPRAWREYVSSLPADQLEGREV
ncbi:hypothetical protein WJX81_004096 [Elliptochloris bilobata]|uniref:DUF6737 domain-containing protein n=1 Tax=Elliptochloris bilobata TaxID=381761 RepID=A0AAW1S5S9_9CHLO